MLYLPNTYLLVPKYGGKFGATREEEGRWRRLGEGMALPERTILVNKMCMCPHDVGGGPCGTRRAYGGITVDEGLAFLQNLIPNVW